MKILFICGSFERGKDGVGDYTRKLAAEAIRNGNICEIIALMDKFIQIETEENQFENEISIKVLRLPFIHGLKKNGAKTVKWISNRKIDWISLQYVPFSFDKRGIHIGLTDIIYKLKFKSKLHIMVHELWVGRGKEISTKQNLLSIVQEKLINQFLKSVKPDLVHTHLPIFKLYLSRIGISSLPLNIFSNINQFTESAFEISESFFVMAFFSQIEMSEKIIVFVNDLCKKLKTRSLYCKLLIIGGRKEKNLLINNEFKVKCPLLDEIVYTDFLEEMEVSKTIASCDLGITPIPHHALGKSGSIATFFLHGVPVAAPIWEDKYFKYGLGFFDTLLQEAILYKPDLDSLLFSKIAARKSKEIVNIMNVGTKFCADLLAN